MASVVEEKKKRRHLSGTSDEREEEVGMSNPRTSSDYNRAGIILAALKKPQCCRTKNLMQPPLASDFG